jgi:hypothetical protein
MHGAAIVWLTGVALILLVMSRVLGTGMALAVGDSGQALQLLSLVVSLPLIVVAIARIRSLLLAPSVVPLAAAGGDLGVLRRIAAACLVICLVGSLAMSLRAAAGIAGVMVSVASLALTIRLLGFEREDRLARDAAASST